MATVLVRKGIYAFVGTSIVSASNVSFFIRNGRRAEGRGSRASLDGKKYTRQFPQ